MTDIREELDRLHAAATPGEWGAHESTATGDVIIRSPSNGHKVPWSLIDGELIAALHNAWPTISARLAALEAVAEAAEFVQLWTDWTGEYDDDEALAGWARLYDALKAAGYRVHTVQPECEVCHQGPMHGVSVFRTNPKGEKGLWRCAEHLSRETRVDPDVATVVRALEGQKDGA